MSAVAPQSPHVPLDAGVIEEARVRQRRHRGMAAAAAGIVAIVLALASGGGNGGAGRGQVLGRPQPDGPGLGGLGRLRSARLISIVGVSLVVPREWYGRTTVLGTGAGDSAWLQATSFPTQRLLLGEDATKAMGPGELDVTICEECLPIQGSVRHKRVSPLTLASDIVPAARTPRGHLVLESSAILNGRLFMIDADFGSRTAARRLLPVVNRVLGTLRVRQAEHG